MVGFVEYASIESAISSLCVVLVLSCVQLFRLNVKWLAMFNVCLEQPHQA